MQNISESIIHLTELVHADLIATPFQTHLISLDANRRFLQGCLNQESITYDQGKQLISMVNHEDFVIAESALAILTENPQLIELNKNEFLSMANQLVKYPSPQRRQSLALALKILGDEALPVIQLFINDDSMWVQRGAIYALMNKEYASVMPILNQLWEQLTNEDALRAVVDVVATYSNSESHQFLQKAALSEYQKPRDEARSRLLLQEITISKDPIKFIIDYLNTGDSTDALLDIVSVLAKLRDKAIPILDQLRLSSYEYDERLIKLVENNWAMAGWSPNRPPATASLNIDENKLLWSRKSLFATKNPEELISLLNTLDAAIKEILAEFPDGLVGIVLYGSTAEGYREAGSDIDRALIVKSKGVVKEMKLRLQNKLGGRWHTDIFSHTIFVDDSGSVSPESTAFIFQGIFLGNKKQLVSVQRSTLEKLSDTQWEEIRSEIYSMLAGSHTIERLRERHSLDEPSDKCIEINRALIRVPYDRATTINKLSNR